MSSVTARAHTNIALVKYWGKRDVALNLPATGSLSLTLDRFHTTTTLEPKDAGGDSLVLDGAPASEGETKRVSRYLDRLRDLAGGGPAFAVTSHNAVPTAAGLASSASAFAALALAGTRALDLEVSEGELSALARQGSGSAARSIFGGFVHMRRGDLDDGSDCIAAPLAAHSSLDVRLLVVRCAEGRKKVGSTEAMERTAQTSPYYPAWVSTHAADLEAAAEAVRDGDLERLGEVMEFSTLKMHASALSARPGIWYLAPTTVAAMNRVRELREGGAACWFTMDAGPHVKVLCPATEADGLANHLRDVDGVHDVDIAGPGPAAALQEQP
jgi:diphosphomevalonate decarboxylase